MFSSAKKEAKAEAQHKLQLADMAGREAQVKSLLKNKEAQYYNLNDVAINYHDVGGGQDGFINEYFEGYIVFCPKVDKNRQVEMESELRELVDKEHLSFFDLMENILARDDENYWAFLYWNAPTFKKVTKPYSSNVKNSQMSYRDERKAVKAISNFAVGLNVIHARDLVKLVMNEFPYSYRLVLFNNSKEISSNLHDKNKFKQAKKRCE